MLDEPLSVRIGKSSFALPKSGVIACLPPGDMIVHVSCYTENVNWNDNDRQTQK